MNEIEKMRAMRRDFSAQGWTLLIYYIIMNVSVIIMCLLGAGIQTFFKTGFGSGIFSVDIYMEAFSQNLEKNGWGYLLAIGIGAMIMLAWKGWTFFRQEIWKKKQKMNSAAFFCLLSFLIACQAIFSLGGNYQEWVLNQFGLTAEAAMESASSIKNSFSMLLYACVFGPVAEELLFRGLILRCAEPYGKRFAILTSAFLFGMFHGNLIQTPYAIAVGLVLGYTAMEYSIFWAIALHIFNNLVLSELLGVLARMLPPFVGEGIFVALLLGFTVAAAWIAIACRKEITGYIKGNRVDNDCVKCFFTAPGILVSLALLEINIVVTVLLLSL